MVTPPAALAFSLAHQERWGASWLGAALLLDLGGAPVWACLACGLLLCLALDVSILRAEGHP
jgi:hypothetical protein